VRRFLPILALLLAGCASRGDTMADDIDALMRRYQGDVPGASVLVLRDGIPVVRRGYGYADLERRVRATPATNYRLASVSKQFTAAAILLLAEDGRLTLDDRLRRWLPELPPATEAITLRQVLTHSSGLVDYEDLMPARIDGQLSDADVLALLARADRTLFAPGSAYRYSNSGYVLLGLVIERASGQGLAEFLETRIFRPLGMAGTLMYEAGRGPDVRNRAYGYSQAGLHWQRTDQSPTSATRGDGGIYSSIEDLARWDAALYDNRLLTAVSRRLAFSPHVEVTGEPYEASYGYGWRITGDTLWHSGESIGFRNVIVRWPAQRMTVVVLSNRDEPEPYGLALRIGARAMRGRAGESAAHVRAISPRATDDRARPWLR
jgi:CubicO group peptidase (beta-lactamase class C family)